MITEKPLFSDFIATRSRESGKVQIEREDQIDTSLFATFFGSERCHFQRFHGLYIVKLCVVAVIYQICDLFNVYSSKDSCRSRLSGVEQFGD